MRISKNSGIFPSLVWINFIHERAIELHSKPSRWSSQGDIQGRNVSRSSSIYEGCNRLECILSAVRRSIPQKCWQGRGTKHSHSNHDEGALPSIHIHKDETTEREIHDRLSFMNLLDYPERLPDARTIWPFRERLSTTGRDRVIWNELQRQLRMQLLSPQIQVMKSIRRQGN